MTAKEMFERIGYSSVRQSDSKIYAKVEKGMTDKNVRTTSFIYIEKETITTFWKTTDLIIKNDYKDHSAETIRPLTLNEFKAIQKQIEELGWNNE